MVLRQGQASTSLRMLDSSLIRMVRQSLYRSFATWRSVVQERERESALEAQRQLMQEHRMRQALVYLGHVRKRSDGDRLRHAWHVLQLHVHSLAAASALADATSALEEARSSAADEQRRRGERLLLMRISGRMRHRGLLRGWLTWVRFAHESVVERIRCASQSSVDELSSRLVSYGEEHRRRVLSRWSRRLTKGLLWKGWHSWLAVVASKEAAMAAEEVDARELAMQMDRSRVVLRRCSRRLRHGEMWRAWQQWRSMVLRQGQASTSLRMLDSSLIRMVRQSLYRSFATWRSVVQERERESALEAQRQLMQEHRMRQALVYLGHVRKRSDGDRLRHAWHVLQLHVHSLAAASALADATSALEEARSSAADEQRRRGERLLLMRISGRMRHRGLLRGWLTWVRFAHESVVERIRCASQSSVDELSSRLVSYGEEHRRRVLSRWSRRLTKGLLWKGWHSWLAAVASSRMSARCAGVLRRGIARMLGRSLSMAFTKWRVTTWVEREAEGAVAVVGVRPDRSSRYGREGVIAMGEMPLGSADALRMRLRRSLLLIFFFRRQRFLSLRYAWKMLVFNVSADVAAAALSEATVTLERTSKTLAEVTLAFEEAKGSAANEQRRRGERLLLMRISGRMRHRGLLRGWLTWVRFAHESVVERIRCASQSSVDELSSRLVSYGEEHRRRVLSRWSRRLTKGLCGMSGGWLAVVASKEAAMAAEEVDARELAMQMDRSRVVLRRCSRRLRHGEMWRAWQQWRSMVLRQGQAHRCACWIRR